VTAKSRRNFKTRLASKPDKLLPRIRNSSFIIHHSAFLTMTIRTRFAPSPTGYMHIGGMRTALFNWLWARHNGGQFILRIDDTDQQRNVEEALQPILQAFRWLGLDWDEGPEIGGPFGPYFQSQRGELYRAAAEKLIAANRAYYDYDPPEQIQADRAEAEKEKRQYLNIRRSLELTDDEKRQLEADGRQPVLRFLVPRDETIAIDDDVRGHVEWDCGLISDPVICRADGSPLYNFATVVDDAQMEITHVIRAEEHLTNTAVQALMFHALGHELPTFAHIPFVAAPGTKEKLSKRDKKIEKYRKMPQFKKMFDAANRVFPRIGLGSSETLNPVMVEYYEQIGYLPEGIFNALSRLGWSYDDKTEIMSREFVVENFTLDRVVKSPAGLDPDKLDSYQQHWMNELPLEEKINGCLPYLERANLKAHGLHPVGSPESRDFLARLLTALGERLTIFSDILDYDEYFVPDDELQYDEKAFNKRIRNDETAVESLKKFRTQLETVEPFDAATTDACLHTFCEAEGIKLGQIIHALRVATTGKPKGPGMFDCLELLGRDRCLARIDRALAQI
jgi:glutamyl-tRNA synthetase